MNPLESVHRFSATKQVIRRILHLLQQCLPTELYRLIYGATFTIYRTFLRYYFLRHYLAYFVEGNTEGKEMVEVIFPIMPYSLVGESGLIQTYQLTLQTAKSGLPGAFVELGVARGGCAAMIAELVRRNCSTSSVWLFDSFEGLPHPTSKDFDEVNQSTGYHIRPLPKGSCLGTYEEVHRLLFDKKGFDPNKVIMVRGWFQDTLPKYSQKIGPIALLRIDADWYEATKCCLNHLFDQVVPGGFVIIDDYGTCFGCRRAVDEFLKARQMEVKLVFDNRGGCSFQKPAKA